MCGRWLKVAKRKTRNEKPEGKRWASASTLHGQVVAWLGFQVRPKFVPDQRQSQIRTRVRGAKKGEKRKAKSVEKGLERSKTQTWTI